MSMLKEGEVVLVQGSGKKPYEIKMSGGVVSCSCPAWRNQSLQIDLRTCKHIKAGGYKDGIAVVAPTESVGPVKAPPVLLAHSWDTVQDPAGYWMSEKYDGVRCWKEGNRFFSRQGNEFHAPSWFTEQLPGDTMDGELWVGRKMFQQTISVVRKLNPVDAEWQKIKYMVFDLPGLAKVFEARIGAITVMTSGLPYVEAVPHTLCNGIDHLKTRLKQVQALGGEGLMIRQPGSMYEAGRSTTLLKVKEFFDAEGVVIGYEPGKGRHKGRVGSLLVRAENGREFSVGSGLTDKEREHPPIIGSRVTYRYQELTDAGAEGTGLVPRFPTFVAVRNYE